MRRCSPGGRFAEGWGAQPRDRPLQASPRRAAGGLKGAQEGQETEHPVYRIFCSQEASAGRSTESGSPIEEEDPEVSFNEGLTEVRGFLELAAGLKPISVGTREEVHKP